MFDPARLVFIDETCTRIAMVAAARPQSEGERLVGYAPHGHQVGRVARQIQELRACRFNYLARRRFYVPAD